MKALNIEEYREEMYYDMAYFGKMCFPSVFTKPTPAFHYDIYETLRDEGNDRILVLCPRFHGKSTTVALVYTLHHVLFQPQDKFAVVVFVSKTQGHAKKLLRNIKHQLNTSETLNDLFGNNRRETWIKDSETELILKDNTYFAALGTGQQIDGFNHLNVRPSLIILDDPENDENTKTKERRSDNLDWLVRAAEPALGEGGRLIVIGTVVHNDCMVVNLNNADGWTKLFYSAHLDTGYIAGKTKEPPVLWKELWPHKKLEKERLRKKSLRKEHIYWMQYENRVQVPEDQLFKPDDIQYYEGELDVDIQNQVVWLDKMPMTVFIGVDPAKSLSEGSDYTVIMVIGISPKRDIYVLEYVRQRILPNKTADMVVEINKRWSARRANVEDVLFSGLIGDALQEKMIESKQWVSVNKIPIPTNMNKKARYQESLVDFFVRKKIYIRNEHIEFYKEFTTFVPGRSKHDDMIDSLWLALRQYYPPPSNLIYIEPELRETKTQEEYDWRAL